jgi:excinuclease UvrABC ATPase subunit
LLDARNRLIETGKTLLVIEHNLDMIRNADESSPRRQRPGGEILAEGPPRESGKSNGHTQGRC